MLISKRFEINAGAHKFAWINKVKMRKYQNKLERSGVDYFECGTDYIVVQFMNDTKYLYNYIRPGKTHVEKMKKLATQGLGLSTYISQHVKDKFYTKFE